MLTLPAKFEWSRTGTAAMSQMSGLQGKTTEDVTDNRRTFLREGSVRDDLGDLAGVDYEVSHHEPPDEHGRGNDSRDPRVVVPQFDLPDVVGDQFVDFEGQWDEDPDANHNDPEEERKRTSHDQVDRPGGTPRRYIETENKQEYCNNGEDHQGEVNRVDHELIGIEILLAHPPESPYEATDETDGGRARHHSGDQEEHGKHGVVPERPGRQHPHENAGVNPHANGDGDSEPCHEATDLC